MRKALTGAEAVVIFNRDWAGSPCRFQAFLHGRLLKEYAKLNRKPEDTVKMVSPGFLVFYKL